MRIIHESVHAELFRTGSRYAESEREHDERACVQAEIDFASKVPGSDEAIAKVQALLETQWWTPTNLEASEVQEARRLGAPKWLIRWATRGRVSAPRSRS
jgi:hypothetical protein